MKKKSCFILAVLMIMIQLVSAFAALPAMAETTKSYDIVGTKDEITVDGKANEAIWNSVESSSAFVNTNDNPINGFNASFKAIWTPNAEDSTKMNVYIFVTATGCDQRWSYHNHIRIQVESGDASTRFWTGMQKLEDVRTGNSPNRTCDNNGVQVPFQLYAVDDMPASKTVTYEFGYTMPKTDTVKFDIKVSAKKSDNTGAEYCWVNLNGNPVASANLGGEGKILPIPEYDIIRTSESMTVDGKANESIWNNVEYSSAFINTKGNAINGFSAKYKAVWAPNAEDSSKMDVYIFVTSTGYTVHSSYRNNIRIQIETLDASHRFWTGLKQLNEMNTGSVDRTATVGTVPVPFKLFSVNSISNSKTATYEFCYTMPKSDTIKLDVMVNARESSAADNDVTYSWVNMTTTPIASANLRGIGNIIDFDINDLNIVTTPGASIRVDTANKEKSGIRFETKVDAAVVAALKDAGATIITGTLVLPTATLTNNGIPDADFTIAKLEEAQLRSGIDYYNIINVGNEWVDGMDGTWFGTVFDVKNLTRQFSAVGYVTVELDGETTTLYGGYVSTNSRSIKDVATILLEGEEVGDGGKWNSAQEAILKNFSLAGTDTN